MKTARRILAIIGVLLVAAITATVLACLALGLVVGLVTAGVVTMGLWTLYLGVMAPWHRTWGATPAEAAGRLPGDDPSGSLPATTRAITIGAPVEAVWPWLVQIGFGRAGWYSYDWIDNDGAPSASRIVPELQGLGVGDVIPMTPTLGFVVRSLDSPTTIISTSDDGGTSWTLHLVPEPDGRCRLISRFRAQPQRGIAARLWFLIADPGAFVMERRMLLGIRDRAESAPAAVH